VTLEMLADPAIAPSASISTVTGWPVDWTTVCREVRREDSSLIFTPPF